MKLKIKMAALSLLIPSIASANSVEPIDYDKVNTIIEKNISSLIEGDAFFKKLGLIIDPASDIEGGKGAILADVTTARTAWSPAQEASLGARLAFTSEAQPDGQLQGRVAFGADIKTSVLPMVQYFLPFLLPHCEYSDSESYIGTVQTALCGLILERSEVLSEFSDLVQLVVDVYGLAGSVTSQYIADTEEKLKNETDPEQRAALQYYLESAQGGQRELAKMSVVAAEAQWSFSYETDQMAFLGVTLPYFSVQFEVGESSWNSALSVGFSMSQEDLQDIKAEFHYFIKMIEVENQEVLGDVRSMAQQYLDFARDILDIRQ